MTTFWECTHDVIILDIMLPKVTCLRLLQRWRNEGRLGDWRLVVLGIGERAVT